MKKILLLLVAVTSIISCSKDDDKTQEPTLQQKIVGNWKLEKQVYTQSNNEYYESNCFKENYSLNITSVENTTETYCKYSVVIGEEIKTLNYNSSITDYTNDPSIKVLVLYSQNGGYNGGFLQKRFLIRSVSETKLELELFYLGDEFLIQGTANLSDSQKKTLTFTKQ